MRRRFIFIFLPLLGLAALMFRDQIALSADHIISRVFAQKALTSWGLTPSKDNVDLYLSLDYSHKDVCGIDTNFTGNAERLKTIPKYRRFSDNWTYGQLFDKGLITIGVYGMDPTAVNRLSSIIQDHSTGSGNLISIELLKSRKDLIRSLASDTIVFYFGHANFGRGIIFDYKHIDAPLFMSRATLDVPQKSLYDADVFLENLGNGYVRIKGGSQELKALEVNCKMFGYFGCRTDHYYREIWNEYFPKVDFIATTYACNTDAMAPEILQKLVQGLYEGHTLEEIVNAMNQGRSSDILAGRFSEVIKYRNPKEHADVLFTY